MLSERRERVDFVLSHMKRDGRAVIAVDGPCASGKTTLVDDLSEKIPFTRISMDDFFLPSELRTPERFSEKDGNIHYERFIDGGIVLLSQHRPFTYRRFSCRTLSYEEKVSVPEGGIIIVEGSYALHPKLTQYWDVSFLLSLDSDEQIRRLTLRSPDKLEMFRTKWIPLENEYFTGCYSIACDVCFVEQDFLLHSMERDTMQCAVFVSERRKHLPFPLFQYEIRLQVNKRIFFKERR